MRKCILVLLLMTFQANAKSIILSKNINGNFTLIHKDKGAIDLVNNDGLLESNGAEKLPKDLLSLINVTYYLQYKKITSFVELKNKLEERIEVKNGYDSISLACYWLANISCLKSIVLLIENRRIRHVLMLT